MSKRHPDIDLILALAAGDLPPDEAARIEAGLDPASKEELATQRAVLNITQQLSQPELSRAETTRLRAGVAERLGPRVSPRPSRFSPPGRIWRRASRALPALAAAASVVVVVAVAVNLGGTPEPEQPASSPSSRTAAEAAPASLAQAPAEPAATTTTPTVPGSHQEALADVVEEEPPHLAEERMAEEALEAAAQAEMAEAETAAQAAMASAESAMDVAVDETSEVEAAAYPVASLSTDQLDYVLRYVESARDRAGDEALPVAELAKQAGELGLACGEAAAAEAEPYSTVNYLGAAWFDDERGEIYVIERPDSGPDPGSSLIILDEDAVVLFLYSVDCRPVAFTDG